LPEAQLDRFLFKLIVDSADIEALDRIISTRRRGEPPTPTWMMTHEQLNSLFSVMDRVYLPRPVARYIARLVSATHPTSAVTPLVKSYVGFGASPRAAIAIAEAARAAALLAGRPTVGFADVKNVAPPVLNHRLILNYKARLDQVDAFAVIRELLSQLDEAGLNLPRDLTVVKVNHE
jgi:MoxR-like ATPase